MTPREALEIIKSYPYSEVRGYEISHEARNYLQGYMEALSRYAILDHALFCEIDKIMAEYKKEEPRVL
jgi:hypothetical protein